jgi:phenylacetate-CoA ligase
MDLPTLLRMGFPAGSDAKDKGFKRALTLFKEASRRVPAYKDFLQKAGIDPAQINTKADFKHVPRTDKPTYITQYSLEELSWDGTLGNARYISTSSGSTGVPFFWPRGVAQDAAVGHMFRNIYRDIFDATDKRTLFVNSFALGTWIAGFEFFNATKWVGDQNNQITIVTPGIDKAEAVNQIKRLSGMFDRIVIGGISSFR